MVASHTWPPVRKICQYSTQSERYSFVQITNQQLILGIVSNSANNFCCTQQFQSYELCASNTSMLTEVSLFGLLGMHICLSDKPQIFWPCIVQNAVQPSGDSNIYRINFTWHKTTMVSPKTGTHQTMRAIRVQRLKYVTLLRED